MLRGSRYKEKPKWCLESCHLCGSACRLSPGGEWTLTPSTGMEREPGGPDSEDPQGSVWDVGRGRGPGDAGVTP